MEGTEEAVLTFVLHGGFTDALFRKWLAICRARGSDLDSALCHITPGFVYPTRVFSLFPSHSTSVVCLACSFIAHDRDFDERAVRRKLILQPPCRSLAYYLLRLVYSYCYFTEIFQLN